MTKDIGLKMIDGQSKGILTPETHCISFWSERFRTHGRDEWRGIQEGGSTLYLGPGQKFSAGITPPGLAKGDKACEN